MENAAMTAYILWAIEDEILPVVDKTLGVALGVKCQHGVKPCRCESKEVRYYAAMIKNAVAAHVEVQAAAKLKECRKTARVETWSADLYELFYGTKDKRCRMFKSIFKDALNLCPYCGIWGFFRKLKARGRKSHKTKVFKPE